MAFLEDESVGKAVCVTGATGFIASHLIKHLLERNYTVHATVRDLGNEKKRSHLLDIVGAKTRLRFFESDLTKQGSFDSAIAGCSGVFHVASPTNFYAKDPENDVIKPGVEGTLNILEACQRSGSVRRVVITSSASALSVKERLLDHEIFDESSWSDVTYLRSKRPTGWAYGVCKTLGEKAALEYGKQNGIDVVTVVPEAVVGPSLTSAPAPSVLFSLSALIGDVGMLELMKEITKRLGYVAFVHVEDVCRAHIHVYEHAACSGRYVCCSVNTSLPMLAGVLKERYPQYYKGATRIDDVDDELKGMVSSKKLLEEGFVFHHSYLDTIFDDSIESLKTIGFLYRN